MFKNLSIKSRLIFVVAFLSWMCVSGAAIGLSSLYFANTGLQTNFQQRLLPISDLDQIMRKVDSNLISLAKAAGGNLPNLAQELDAIDQRTNEIEEIWTRLVSAQAEGQTEQQRALTNELAAAHRKFTDEGLRPAVAALRNNDTAQAQNLVQGPLEQLSGPLSDAANKLIQYQTETARAEYERNQTIYIWVRNTCLAGMAFAVLLGAVICIWLLRAIARPLADAVEVARSVAAGDLTRQIEVNSSDETGQLLRALKDMNESLVRIVSEVRAGTDTIATASREIAAGNLDLSSRTESQASALEETASSMEELTGTVTQNAASAQQANKLAESASEVALKGGQVVSQVVATMGEINDSSKRIADIIGVIDSIAFQTNILALNASVEAARAGEQGKGFAVVATEVRQLAQRSASAAKEIKSLIDESVEKVHLGAQLVDQAGATMDEIVTSVKRVTDIMAEISTASREQTEGIQQVNMAITQMDSVTQQNAALVEEAAAAAGSLQDQAAHLARVVSVFKLHAQSLGGRPAISTSPQVPAVKKAPEPASVPAPAPAPVTASAGTPVAAPPAVKRVPPNLDANEWEEF